MQPAQLSLLPDRCPAPPTTMFPELPDRQVTEAVALLAGLIAKAAVTTETTTAAAGGEDGYE